MRAIFLHKKRVLRIVGTVILAALFIMTFIWFVITTKQLYRSGELETIYAQKHASSYANPTLAPDVIKPWMTFDYVNFLFRLPSGYLKDRLGITDPRYPNIRIDQYAKHHNINGLLFLQNVQQAITSYPASLPEQPGE